MSRFGNIDRRNRTRPRGERLLPILILLLFADQVLWSQGKPKGSDPVRTDEKGRKFVNNIPFDVFFDDPLGIVANNKNAVAPSANASAESPKESKSAPAESAAPVAKTDGVAWKDLLPVDELQSEVKSIRNSLTKAMTNQGSYKSNFKEIAIEGAEIAALAGILQSHPETLTWKDKAHYVRDFGAQLNQSAIGLSKENFDNSKSAFLRLSSVLDGSVPDDAGDVPETRPFNEAASRKGLMKRIERAKNFLQQDVNSEAKFKSLAEQARHEAAIIAALGTVITTSGYEYTADDEYQKHARSLIDGGTEASSALQDEAFDRFKQAVDKVNKSCTDCHQSYGTQ